MPFTPFHLGFGIFLFALCPYIDAFAILIGTVFIDIEGILYMLFAIGVQHGYTHSLLGVMIYLIPCSVFSWLIYKINQKITNREYKFNIPLSLLSSFIGLVSHIFFDGCLYPEMKILYPFSTQTGHLFGIMNNTSIVILLSSLFAAGVFILVVKILLRYRFKKNILISYNFPLQTKSKEKELDETPIL